MNNTLNYVIDQVSFLLWSLNPTDQEWKNLPPWLKSIYKTEARSLIEPVAHLMFAEGATNLQYHQTAGTQYCVYCKQDTEEINMICDVQSHTDRSEILANLLGQ